MNIVVLNGSPKGNCSVTIQTVNFLKAHYPDDNFNILNIGQQIRKFQGEEQFNNCMNLLIDCEMILMAYPVYTFIAPYQMHRFIEQIKQSERVEELKGKFITQITTSKHFYDVTAHNYIEDNAYDLELKVIKGLSSDMDDLLTTKGQDSVIKYWDYVRFSVANDIYNSKEKNNVINNYLYQSTKLDSIMKTTNDTVIITNCSEDDIGLKNMINDFIAVYPYYVRILNINDFKFDGGCLGCFTCAFDGKCVYKDGFEDYLRNHIQSAKAMIFAATIKDHSMGASFKIYDDRQFCNGHRTVTMGMPVGYILSGNYSLEDNLRTIIEGRASVGHNYLAGIASNESQDDKTTFMSLNNLAKNMKYAIDNKMILPQNFLGIGGMKIFRDLIYVMQGMMQADHKFYKKHNFYDFPQKKRAMKWKMKLIGFLMSKPSIKKKIKGKLNNIIIKPYQKAIEKSLINK